jgi:hypothetical protein
MLPHVEEGQTLGSTDSKESASRGQIFWFYLQCDSTDISICYVWAVSGSLNSLPNTINKRTGSPFARGGIVGREYNAEEEDKDLANVSQSYETLEPVPHTIQ